MPSDGHTGQPIHTALVHSGVWVVFHGNGYRFGRVTILVHVEYTIVVCIDVNLDTRYSWFTEISHAITVEVFILRTVDFS